MFGRRRARGLLTHAGQSPNAALTAAMDQWRSYLAGAAPEDDVCVLLVRAA
jgi:serine phosphatase RsbU (regulator of sigma subunit)